MATMRVARLSTCCTQPQLHSPARAGPKGRVGRSRPAPAARRPGSSGSGGASGQQRQRGGTAGGEDLGPFRGTFGPWRVEREDLVEVWAYRVSLSVVAAAFAAGTLGALCPEDSTAASLLRPAGNLLAAGGAAGLGLSLALIHIYVAALKRLLQALFGAGVAGGGYLMLTHPEPLPAFVAGHPYAVWLIGPAFAALTGVAFKETFCYRKYETLALTLAIPALLLGHLTGLAPAPVEQALAGGVAALLLLFAGRKYTQPVKDDIGDKSVFEYYKLSEPEQEELVAKLRQQGQLFD